MFHVKRIFRGIKSIFLVYQSFFKGHTVILEPGCLLSPYPPVVPNFHEITLYKTVVFKKWGKLYPALFYGKHTDCLSFTAVYAETTAIDMNSL